MYLDQLKASLVGTARYFKLDCLKKSEFLHDRAVLAHTRRGRVVLKLHRPGFQTQKSLSMRIHIQFDLHKLGMPCPRPLIGEKGFVLALPDMLITAYEYVYSSITDMTIQETAKSLGLILAKLHNMQTHILVPRELSSCCNDQLLKSEKKEERIMFGPGEGAMCNSHNEVKLSEDSIADRNLELGLVHCDVHLGNIIQNPSGDNILLDFDLCHFGPLAEDLGNTIFSLKQKSLPKAEAQDRVLQAYCETRQIRKIDERAISYFVKKKALVSQLWLSRKMFMPPRDGAS